MTAVFSHDGSSPAESATPAPASCSSASHPGLLGLLGSMPYLDAWDLQNRYRTERAARRCPDLLLLMEHPPVFTAGRTTQDAHLPTVPASYGEIPLVRTERGGSVTYHGPGQLIGYPILKLTDHCAGPKAYVRGLETILIRTLAAWGITAYRRDGLPGVWVGDDHPKKIASIGVRIAKGITTHGFALNVSLDLAPFSFIVPCGIADCLVTSMTELLGTTPPVDAVAQQVAAEFAGYFSLHWTDRFGPDRLPSGSEPSLSNLAAHSPGPEEIFHA